MMAQRLLQTIAFCILSTAAVAQNVYVKAGTIGRFDIDTNGVRTREPESTYTNALLKYPFSYDDDSPYYDCSTNLHNGAQATADDRPTWTNGWGGVYLFDGSSDFISAAALSFPDDEGTLCYWAKASAAVDTPGIVGLSTKTDPDDWYSYSGSTMYTTVFLTTRISFSHGMTSTNWNFIAFTSAVGAGNWKAYVNGVQTHTATGYSLAGVTNAVLIGKTSDGAPPYCFPGLLDDVRILDRALTTNEQLSIYMQELTIANGGKR